MIYKQKFIALSCAALLFMLSGMQVQASCIGHAETVAGLCSHHTEHTAECMAGTPCSHEHTQDCYNKISECIHVHSAACRSRGSSYGYKRCTHVCSQTNGCVTLELNCEHEHNEDCYYAEDSVCSYVCDSCHGNQKSTEQSGNYQQQSSKGHHGSHHSGKHHG